VYSLQQDGQYNKMWDVAFYAEWIAGSKVCDSTINRVGIVQQDVGR